MVILMKRVNDSQIIGQGLVGKLQVRWIDVMEKYIDRGGKGDVNVAKRECINRIYLRLLPWPPTQGKFLEGPGHQNYR